MYDAPIREALVHSCQTATLMHEVSACFVIEQVFLFVFASEFSRMFVQACVVYCRYCGLLQFKGEVRTKCLQNLTILLCHKFPRVTNIT